MIELWNRLNFRFPKCDGFIKIELRWLHRKRPNDSNVRIRKGPCRPLEINFSIGVGDILAKKWKHSKILEFRFCPCWFPLVIFPRFLWTTSGPVFTVHSAFPLGILRDTGNQEPSVVHSQQWGWWQHARSCLDVLAMVIVVANFYPSYSYSSTTIVDIVVHSFIIVIAIVQLLYIIVIVSQLYHSYSSSQLYHS